MESQKTKSDRRHRPVQFGIGTLLVATAALAALLGTLRGLGASPGIVAVVFGIVVIATVAAVLFVLSLSRMFDRDDQPRDPKP